MGALADDPPLLERAAELSALQAGVRRLGAGYGSVILLEAAAGVGKTALLERAAREAARAGCLVRRAAPTPAERDFPLGVVRTLLEAPVRTAPERQRAALFDGAAKPAAKLLLGGTGADPAEHDNVAIAHSILWLSAGIASGRGLALIVDDAHWSDVPSLEVLAYLARRIEDVRVLLVLATRPGAVAPGNWGAATMLRPAPLAEGTPWLLVALAHQLRHDPACRVIAPAVRDVVRGRLLELTPVQRAAAAALSVLRHDDAPMPADPARQALVSSGLIDPAAEKPAHPVIAAAIREELPAAELAAARAQRAWLATERGTASAATCAALALEALGDGGALLDAAAHNRCIRVLIMTDAVEQARRAIDALPDRASDCAAWYASELALRTGDLIAAERHARQALELTSGEPAALAGARHVLLWALAERGAFPEAHELLDASTTTTSASLLHARARLHLAEGRYERAYADACAVGSRRTDQGRTNPAWDGWRSTAALALAHLGRRPEAVTLSETELAMAKAFGAPVPIARALAARAVAESDEFARVMLCNEALGDLTDCPAMLETVRLRIELGGALARTGRRVEARGALRPALADADRAAARPLAERARRELVATGLRPRRAALEGPGALTPRQRQICDLAAAGKANRAIATELFLSTKTVETHLAAAYRKLGVRARTQLVGRI